jgi:hypothetical protein
VVGGLFFSFDGFSSAWRIRLGWLLFRLRRLLDRKIYDQYQKTKNANKAVIATYLALLGWKSTILFRDKFSIQTGPYPQLSLGPAALNTRCLITILSAAYRLHRVFHDYSFVVDSHIQNCQNLREGMRQIVADASRVKTNLASFDSPLHSVFFTNQTRFNHYVLGKMGLHINVNRNDEVRRRLIAFKIGRADIRHEEIKQAAR